jgi:hypothetical protein
MDREFRPTTSELGGDCGGQTYPQSKTGIGPPAVSFHRIYYKQNAVRQALGKVRKGKTRMEGHAAVAMPADGRIRPIGTGWRIDILESTREPIGEKKSRMEATKDLSSRPFHGLTQLRKVRRWEKTAEACPRAGFSWGRMRERKSQIFSQPFILTGSNGRKKKPLP